MTSIKYIHILSVTRTVSVTGFLRTVVAVAAVLVPFLVCAVGSGQSVYGDGQVMWLRMKPSDDMPKIETRDRTPVARTAVRELQAYWKGGNVLLVVDNSMQDNDGFRIEWNGDRHLTVVRARHSAGLLYGAYELLRIQQTCGYGLLLDNASACGKAAPKSWKRIATGRKTVCVSASFPAFDYRMIGLYDGTEDDKDSDGKDSCLLVWTEINGNEGTMSIDLKERLAAYSRAGASVGINGTVLNGADLECDVLKPEYLDKVRVVANALRPYGMKTFLSVSMFSPVTVGGLDSADPLDMSVKDWWKKKVKEVYARIPDFGGFLVNADHGVLSGPDDYLSPYVSEANMLADALAQYGGVVIWRGHYCGYGAADEYTGLMAAEFKALDGKFASNVVLQFNPVAADMTPLEPYARIFGQIRQTPMLVELQIAPDRLVSGESQSNIVPVWKDFFHIVYINQAGRRYDSSTGISSVLVGPSRISGMAGTLSEAGGCMLYGDSCTQANWYAFGRLAWNPSLAVDSIAGEWLRQTSVADTVPAADVGGFVSSGKDGNAADSHRSDSPQFVVVARRH